MLAGWGGYETLYQSFCSFGDIEVAYFFCIRTSVIKIYHPANCIHKISGFQDGPSLFNGFMQ